MEREKQTILENNYLRLIFNNSFREFNLIRRKDNFNIFSNSVSSIFLDNETEYSTSMFKGELAGEKVFTSTLGKGKKITINFKNNKNVTVLTQKIWFYNDLPYIVLQIIYYNRSHNIEKIANIYPLQLKTNSEFTLSKNKELHYFEHGDELGNKSICRRILKNKDYKSHSITVVGDIISNESIVAGYISSYKMEGVIELKTETKGDSVKIRKLFARLDGENIELLPNSKIISEKLFIGLSNTPLVDLNNYARLTGEEMKACPWSYVPTGWFTCFFADEHQTVINQDNIKKSIEYLSKHKNVFPIEYIQIDDGYQTEVGDWLSIRKDRFPDGIEELVKVIKNKGFKPAIWIAPFTVTDKSNFYKDHPDAVIKEKNGDPLLMRTGWEVDRTCKCYGLDCSHPAAQKWLKEVFHTMKNKWGIEYFKLDFLSDGGKSGECYNNKITKIERYRKGLGIIRDIVGEKTCIQVAGELILPSIGFGNIGRVSEDITPYWDQGWGGLFPASRNNLLRWYMHKNFWVAYPSGLIIREKNGFTRYEAEIWATIVGLGGGQVLLSGNLSELSEERKKMAMALLPPFEGKACPIDFLQNEVPSIYSLKINKKYDSWHVVGLFNWDEKSKDLKIDFDKLGLSDNSEYHVFEYWSKKYLGKHKNEITEKINPHSTKLLLIKKCRNIPQVISSSIHITQGGVEISDMEWNRKKKRLTIDFKHKGYREGVIYLYIPDNMVISAINDIQNKIEVKNEGDRIYSFRININKKNKVFISILKNKFKEKYGPETFITKDYRQLLL